MAVQKTTEQKDKDGGYSEQPESLIVRKDGSLKNPSPRTKKRRAGKKAGKHFEDELRELITATFGYCRRVFDTRSFQGAGSTRMISPKVHTDFEGIAYTEAGYDKHAYFEAKSSKSHPSFSFWTSIVEEKKCSKIYSKEHQWGWVREVYLNANYERAFYMICNRHSQKQFYIVVLEWSDVEHWMNLCKETDRKSIQWTELMRRAKDPKILYQDANSDQVTRFVTDENIRKIRDLMNMRYADNKELNYAW